MTARTAAFAVPPPEPAAPALKITTAVLSLAVAVGMHIAVAVWWASGLNARVGQLESTLGPTAGDASLSATMARLDERTKRMDKREDGMASRVQRLEERQFGHSVGEDRP